MDVEWIEWLKEVASLVTALGIISSVANKYVVKPAVKKFEDNRDAEREYLNKRSMKQHEEMMQSFRKSIEPHIEKLESNSARIGRVETRIYDHEERLVDVEEETFEQEGGE